MQHKPITTPGFIYADPLLSRCLLALAAGVPFATDTASITFGESTQHPCIFLRISQCPACVKRQPSSKPFYDFHVGILMVQHFGDVGILCRVGINHLGDLTALLSICRQASTLAWPLSTRSHKRHSTELSNFPFLLAAAGPGVHGSTRC